MLFRRRNHAANLLAHALRPYCDPLSVICAIPGGGVIMGCEVAEILKLPIELISVRSLYGTYRSERALGTVTEDYVSAFRRNAASDSDRDLPLYVERQAHEAKQERERAFGFHPHPAIFARPVLIVDQGEISPSTVAAVVETLRARGAIRVVLAAPMLSTESYAAAKRLADKVVILSESPPVAALGNFYDDIPMLALEEIIGTVALNRATP